MKFGINLSEASTRHGFIKAGVFLVGLVMLWTGHGDVAGLLILANGLEGTAKIVMPDDQSKG